MRTLEEKAALLRAYNSSLLEDDPEFADVEISANRIGRHFADRQARHERCVEDLRGGKPPTEALFWEP